MRLLIRQDQAISSGRSYSAHGQTLSEGAGDGYANPIGFTGGYLDADSKLYKLGIRYYDPALGRFTQPDPTGQDPHYTYAGDNPLNAIDTSGAVNTNCGIITCTGYLSTTETQRAAAGLAIVGIVSANPLIKIPAGVLAVLAFQAQREGLCLKATGGLGAGNDAFGVELGLYDCDDYDDK